MTYDLAVTSVTYTRCSGRSIKISAIFPIVVDSHHDFYLRAFVPSCLLLPPFVPRLLFQLCFPYFLLFRHRFLALRDVTVGWHWISIGSKRLGDSDDLQGAEGRVVRVTARHSLPVGILITLVVGLRMIEPMFILVGQFPSYDALHGVFACRMVSSRVGMVGENAMTSDFTPSRGCSVSVRSHEKKETHTGKSKQEKNTRNRDWYQ